MDSLRSARNPGLPARHPRAALPKPLALPLSAHPQGLRVTLPSVEVQRGNFRVQCPVDGEPLWFETSDGSLCPSLEAFGSALLLPAVASGKRLEFTTPPDAVWLRNVGQVLAIASDWWGYPEHRPVVLRETSAVTPPRVATGTALCFSGGVDSFYTLLRGELRVDDLVFAHGYDMDLADTVRASAAEASLRNVAAELGIQAVLVRTNLRAHHTACEVNWEHTHGGALAAIGHLLSDRIHQLLISSSYPRVFEHPWGTHWTLDPCWGSSRLDLLHVGAEKWRAEKLASLMDEPLVRSHLRVCWENHSPTGNCGLCEKCLRTMLVLEGHGRLDAFPVFPTGSGLSQGLGRLPTLRSHLVEVYAGFLRMNLRVEVRQAVEALLERTRKAQQPPAIQRWWRWLNG